MRFRPVAMTLQLASAILLACGGSSGPDMVPAAITGFTPGTTSLSLTQASSKQILFVVDRSSSYEGSVTLKAEDVPTGMVAVFAPATLAKGANLTQLTVTALPSLAGGNYTIKAVASGTAIESKSVPIEITVTVPTIGISVGAASGPLEQLGTITIPVSLTRGGGYEGDIGLSVLGVPAGVTASFSPAIVEHPTVTSTLNLSALLSATLGPANITVRAGAANIPVQQQSVQLNVIETTTPQVIPSVSPQTAASAIPGTSYNYQVGITRLAGFNGAVTVTPVNLPEGVTAVPAVIQAGATQGSLTLNVAADAPASVTTLTLRFSAPGISDRTANAIFRVVIPLTIALEIRSGELGTGPALTQPIIFSVARGSSQQIFLVVRRTGESGPPVALLLLGTPPGVTSNISNAPASAQPVQPATFTLTVGAQVVPGSYDLVIAGNANPLPLQLLPFRLVVN